jgi:tripartite-type tricarboxylate transporter receptor subunit TctC
MAIVRVFVFLAALFAPVAVIAQGVGDFPSRSVKIIVPFAAGGPADLVARLIAQNLNESLGKPFYIENHPGTGGNIGIGLVAQSAPDGYTILFVTSSLVVNPSLYAKVPYDVYKDLAPISLAALSASVLVTNSSLPVSSVKEMIGYLKANPGKGSIGTPGIGTTAYLAAEVFKRSLALDLVQVPFDGAGPTVNAVLGGHVTLALIASPTAAQHLKQGTLRALAVTSEKRSPLMPEIPTMAEAGVPGDQVSDIMLGVLAPAGTPRGIIDLLQREIAKAMAQPDVKQRLDALGFDTVASTPDEFAARIRREVPKWAKVIREAQIKPE